MMYRIIERVYRQIPLKYQQRLKDLEFKDLQNMRIEFTNGVVQKTFNYEVLTNKIHLIQTSTVVKEILRILLKLETLPIFVMIYLLSTQDLIWSEFYITLYTMLCLILDMVISFYLFFSTIRQRWKFEDSINKQRSMIFADLSQLLKTDKETPTPYQMIEWQDVKIGHIICLQKGERSPADLLILDSSQEQVTINFQIKYPCPCTFVNQISKTKGGMTKFLVNLSGWIQFQSLSLGTIKLKNDPKVTQFTQNNIIQRGELLSHSDWIFGMAVQVGHSCFSYRDKYYNWNSINQNSFYIFLIEALCIIVLLVPKLIYSSQNEQYQNTLIVCLLLFPGNYFWLNQLWLLFHSLAIKEATLKPAATYIQEYPILQEYDDRVLIQIQKIMSTNNSAAHLPSIKANPSVFTLEPYYQMSNQNILELIKTDVIVFENPQQMLKQNIRVNLIMHEKSKFYFNYEKLWDIVSKVTPSQKHNYDKLLLDTNRFSVYDEQKTLDIDLLLAEKQIPTLRIIEQGKPLQKIGFLKEQNKLQTKEMKDSKDLKKSNGDQQKLNPYNSFRKQSARNLFQSQNTLAQQQQQQQSQSNSLAPYQNSPKLQRQKSNNQISVSQQSINQKSQVSSLKNILLSQHDLSSDQIVGDTFNESDFIGKLFNKSDVVSNEILVMLLLCNNVQSIYNSQTKQLEHVYQNYYDQAILEFAKICDYRFICSTIIDNYKTEYRLDQITKKAVSIQGVIKVFDIIALLEPTENRKNVISVLVKDPESFELEEGALLYTRIETNEKNDKDQRFQPINDVIDEMFWNGQKSFIYFKQQLDSKQTDQFLTKLNSINETYGNREEELEKLYSSYEQESTLLNVLGLRQHMKLKNELSSQELQFDNLKKEKLFSTLLKSNFKICVITNNYEELITFIRTYHVVEQNQVKHFNEVNTLHFKFRQHLTHLIENENILEVYQQKSIENFLIINDETLEAIIKDDYLKYHFAVLFYFSQGVGAYNLDEKQKGKLLKLLQITERYITTIGMGLDNQYFFYKSNFSFNIVNQDPQCAIANPHFLVKKIQEIFKLFFFYCPLTYLNYEAFILVQIYRCFFFGFLCYLIDYQNSISMLNNFIIFYTVPSNIVTCILNYDEFLYQQTFPSNLFDIYKKRLDMIKQGSIYLKIYKVIIVAIMDGVIVLVCFNIFNSFHYSQVQEYDLFLYIIVEFIEKQKYLILKIDSYIEKITIIRLCVAYSIFLFLLALVYGLTTEDIQFQLSSINFTFWIFGVIFSLSISFIIQESLVLTDCCISCQNDLCFQIMYSQEIEKIHHSMKYLYSSQSGEAKKFIESLFEGKDFMDELLVKKIKGDQQMTDQMERDLKFSDNRTEKDFLNFLKPQQYYVYIVYELAILGIRIYQQITNLTIPYLVISLVEFVVISLITTIRISKFQPLFSLILRFIFFIVLRSILDTGLIEVEMFLIAFSVAHHPSLRVFAYYSICVISVIFDIFMTGIYNNGDPYYILKHGFILIEICVPLMAQVYKTEFISRYQYVLQNKLSDEYKKLNDALGLLMPRFIKERMSKGQILISEDQGDVAILFCDIYEFDDVIKNEQIRLVDFLDNLYRQFDQFCQANELQKIETVGKTYMAAGGLKDYNMSTSSNPTERILDTALQMIESVKTMKYGDNKAVILKIGIHYGRVIAGVIGAHKPQFSLIGDTVNTTSRVCSTSEPGIITLSQQAYEKVNNQKYQFQLREVEAKGKGIIKTYQLVKMSKKQQQHVLQKADDISKSPNPHTPQLMIKQIQRNFQGKKQTIMKKVSFTDDKLINPITIQNTNANAKLLMPQVIQQIQPINRASSRSVFNSSYQMQLLTPNEDQDKEKDQNHNQNQNQTNINNNQDEGLQASIQIGGGAFCGTVNKNKLARASGLNSMKQRKSVYKKANTRTHIGDCDPILGMATGGQKLAESVRMEMPKVRKQKSIKQQLDFAEKVESLSNHKTPRELRGERLDELEIRKLQLIQDYQNEEDFKTMEEKVELEEFGIQESDYKSENHDLYFTIYDQYKDYHYKQIRITMTFVICLLIIKNLIYLLLKDANIDLLILLVCQTAICLLLFIIINNVSKIELLKWLIIFYFLIFSVINILIISIHESKMQLIFELSQIASVYLNVYYLQIYSQKERIKLSVLFVLLQLIILLYHDYILDIVLFSLSVVIMSFIAQYQEMQILAENYQYYSQFQSKNAKQTQILQYLLPQHIIGRFFSAEVNTTDSFTDVFEDCTILFADIAGFTKYSSSVEAEQVVNMLRTLYQQFDEACQKFQVYKLYTIGDCYVCMGIIDANNRDPLGEAINVVLFGLKMIQIIQQINKDPQFQHLNMRIGAHTGRVIGGVVGTDVVRYDIYGEDVTIANKMESKGQEGRIMVSQATKDLIESDRECIDIFDFEFSQDVFLPQNNTTISTYFVQFDQIADDQ